LKKIEPEDHQTQKNTEPLSVYILKKLLEVFRSKPFCARALVGKIRAKDILWYERVRQGHILFSLLYRLCVSIVGIINLIYMVGIFVFEVNALPSVLGFRGRILRLNKVFKARLFEVITFHYPIFDFYNSNSLEVICRVFLDRFWVW